MQTGPAVLAILTAVAMAAPALAQQPGAAGASSKAKAAAAPSPVEPALAPLVEARASEMVSAGIRKIVARTGGTRRDIQILTIWGPGYLGWPKGVKPVAFEIEVGDGRGIVVRADGYTQANRARYAAAFDAVIPRALRVANGMKESAQRPRK